VYPFAGLLFEGKVSNVFGAVVVPQGAEIATGLPGAGRSDRQPSKTAGTRRVSGLIVCLLQHGVSSRDALRQRPDGLRRG